MNGNTVQVSTNTSADFAGEQFVLWWDGDTQQSSTIQGLAFFLDPPYDRPTGSNVKTIAAPADLTEDLSHFDTLDFEGTVAVGSTGAQAFLVPANIDTVFLGPGAWVQGKAALRAKWRRSCASDLRPRCAGCQPVQLHVAAMPQFNRTYRRRISGRFVDSLPMPDSFLFDGLIITDTDYYATDRLANATLNNMKIIGWTGTAMDFSLG